MADRTDLPYRAPLADDLTRPRRARFAPTRPLRRRSRTAASVLSAVLIAAGALLPFSPATAADYPTWDEVQAAKANTAAAAQKVSEITALISGLEAQLAEAQALAEQRGAELQVAEDKLFDATQRADELASQAAASRAQAEAASAQAGRLAAQLYRTGGGDLSVNLFLDGQTDADADQLLSKLGSMSKLAERSDDIYARAKSAENAAASLTAEAEVAAGERERLRGEAEAALQEAQAAAEAAADALAETEAQKIELEAQVAALQSTEQTTVAEYQKGVEEAQRRAREAAAAAAAGGPGLPAGYISDQGWAVPAAGRITGNFGPRASICSGGGCSSSYHRGTDIGTGCGAALYSAAAGTVVYAGPNGTYGNFVLIDHGGVQTGYAHIRPGGIFVGVGQSVAAGQNIASSGTTGASTGCHLHFEVRPGGTPVNAAIFMAQRGAPLG